MTRTALAAADATMDLRTIIHRVNPPILPDPHPGLSRGQLRWAFICTGTAGLAAGALLALVLTDKSTPISGDLLDLLRASALGLVVVAVILLSTRAAVAVLIHHLNGTATASTAATAAANAAAVAIQRSVTDIGRLAASQEQITTIVHSAVADLSRRIDDALKEAHAQGSVDTLIQTRAQGQRPPIRPVS